jgi:prenyl protein peptidase
MHAHSAGPQTVYCLVYVFPLYTSAATRASPTRSRDDPATIRARIRAVSCSTAACSAATLLILYLRAPSGLSPWHLMGYWPLGLLPAARALLLTAMLFAAPLYETLIVDGAWAQWRTLEPLREVWAEWPVWRNMVAVREQILLPTPLFSLISFL